MENTENAPKLGEIIKKHRKFHKMTLKELAENLNIDQTTLFKYENGTIKNIPEIKINTLSSIFGPDFFKEYINFKFHLKESFYYFCKDKIMTLIKTEDFKSFQFLYEDEVFKKSDDILDIKEKVLSIIEFFYNPNIEQNEKEDIFLLLQNEFFKSKFQK